MREMMVPKSLVPARATRPDDLNEQLVSELIEGEGGDTHLFKTVSAFEICMPSLPTSSAASGV